MTTLELPDPSDPNRQVRAVFSALAATYDDLRFLQSCAGRLIDLAALPVGARILDVATGTGVVALSAAQVVGPTGRVVGVDVSVDMLGRARHKLALTDLTHVEFREGDAQHLDLPDRTFDFVLCASSLFFVPDMLGALREWRRVLAPGGRVGFSSFGPTFLQPLRDLWEARLHRYGLTAAPLPTHRLADPTTCRQLLQDAGFTNVQVHTEQLGDFFRTADERWKDIQAGPEGKPLLALDPAQQEQARADHLEELAALATPQGIWLDVPVNFAFAQT